MVRTREWADGSTDHPFDKIIMLLLNFDIKITNSLLCRYRYIYTSQKPVKGKSPD